MGRESSLLNGDGCRELCLASWLRKGRERILGRRIIIADAAGKPVMVAH